MKIKVRDKQAMARKHDLMHILRGEGLSFRSIRQGPSTTRVNFSDVDDASMGVYMLEEEGYNVEQSGKMLMVSHDLEKQKRSSVMESKDIARSLVAVAKSLTAEGEEGVDELDEKFVSKLRTLRGLLSKISQKKRRKLGQLGIGVLRQTATVEDLVDALLVAANS